MLFFCSRGRNPRPGCLATAMSQDPPPPPPMSTGHLGESARIACTCPVAGGPAEVPPQIRCVLSG